MLIAGSFEVRKPQINACWPIWWHHHGMKLRISRVDEEHKFVIIAGSAVDLEITHQKVGANQTTGFFVSWQIRFAGEELVSGKVFMTPEILNAAFGITNDSAENGQWIIKRYGATSAAQGLYIRWKRFLNIPCPGTGHDGDPNVSIEIDSQMQNAIRSILVG